MENSSRKWYKKKRYIIPISAISIFALANSGNYDQSSTSSIQNSPIIETVTPQTQEVKQVETKTETLQNVYTNPTSNNNLSNDNYYTNSKGNTVHSPAYTNDNLVPAGASARCRDGTYSFSQSRRGTCSHHGGVASWL